MPVLKRNSMPHSKRTSVNLQNHLAPARSSVQRPTRQKSTGEHYRISGTVIFAQFALNVTIRSTRLSHRRLTLGTRDYHAETRQPVYMFLRSLAIIVLTYFWYSQNGLPRRKQPTRVLDLTTLFCEREDRLEKTEDSNHSRLNHAQLTQLPTRQLHPFVSTRLGSLFVKKLPPSKTATRPTQPACVMRTIKGQAQNSAAVPKNRAIAPPIS